MLEFYTFLIKNRVKFKIIHPDVKELQIFLNTHGYPLSNNGSGSPGNETTKFGPLTKKALIEFQKVNNLKPDGIFGPLTRATLNNLIK